MTNEVMGPILLQRQCDGGKDEMSSEEWAHLIAERLKGNPTGYMGCGTIFQWYWGSGCLCPGCGRQFSLLFRDLEKYRVQERAPQFDERAIEERILRNVLTRLSLH